MPVNKDLYPKGWSEWSKAYRVGKVCEVCGGDQKLGVDHFDGDPHNNNPANLTILCPQCHARKEWLRWQGRTRSRQHMLTILKQRKQTENSQLRLI